MKRMFALAALVASVSMPLSVLAWGIPGLGGGSSSSGGQDLSASQDQLVTQYRAAGSDVVDANLHLANALDLKDQADKLKAVQQAATSGSSSETLEKTEAALSDSTKAIQEAMKSPAPMDASKKVEFSTGLVKLAQGLIKYSKMKEPASKFSSGLSSSPTAAAKLQAGASIVKALPTDVQNISSFLQGAINFAKANDIKVPDDATSALKDL